MPTPIRFDRGLLVSASPPTEGAADWRFDSRRREWIAPAILNFHAVAALRDAEAFEPDGFAETGNDAPGTSSFAAGIGLTGFESDWHPVRWPAPNVVAMRDYQAGAVAAWMDGMRGQVILPTGSGKTDVALEIMRRTGVSTLVVAPIRDLMYQWHRRIRTALGIDAGIIGDSLFDVRPVSCTTYDSAAIHMETLGNRFKLLIFDEEHHLPGDYYSQAATFSTAPWRLGLSATPERADGRHDYLDELVGPVWYRKAISEAKGSILADYEVLRIPVHLSEAMQAEYDRLGETIRGYMAERLRDDPAFNSEKLCADSVSDPRARAILRARWRRKSIEDRAPEKQRVLEDLFLLHRGQPTIVFAGSNAMARDVALRFLIPPILAHCGKEERAEIMERFAGGRYPAIVANRVLDEGVDVPAAKVAVVLGGLASTRQATQRLGRVLRPSAGQRAVLYEVVCQDTGDVLQSRKRRRTDAYTGTRHLRG